MNNFTEKLKKIIEDEGLTASKFAEKIGVQRSSVSHVLSGRNKPSLDFILKINKSIDNINLDWLLDNDTHKIIEPLAPISKNDTVNNSDVKNELEKIILFFKDGSFKMYKN
ncbi:helix-turn-helix domain-containing protein [Flavobacteriaceae bacterium]|nr:helix-turn-helix domain-containing protein [Flavobacteriaceae bacterium]